MTEQITDAEGKVKTRTENVEAPFDHGAICIKYDFVESEVFSINEMPAEPPFPCDYVISRNGHCKRVMTATTESIRSFKNHKLHTLKMKMNVQYNLCF